MLFLLLIGIIGAILWTNGSRKLRKVIAYTAIGTVTLTLLYTIVQFNTSQSNAVSVQSEGIKVGDISIQHVKQQAP